MEQHQHRTEWHKQSYTLMKVLNNFSAIRVIIPDDEANKNAHIFIEKTRIFALLCQLELIKIHLFYKYCAFKKLNNSVEQHEVSILTCHAP
jgi:hypothetical protein